MESNNWEGSVAKKKEIWVDDEVTKFGSFRQQQYLIWQNF
jgi:hypothetical protein